MIIRLIIIFGIVTILNNELSGQVVINEIMPGNATIFPDEDGDFDDWIELYNSSTSPVNILNYGLSDDTLNLNKWRFPNISIPATSFLTVFASGKDRKTTFDHWETIVKSNDNWKYLVPVSEPDSNWRKLPFNDAAWLQGKGGIGYGDGDDSTVISPAISILIRKTFTVIDTSVIAKATLHIDYDDSFVAYLNGVEIARSNVGVNGTPPAFDELAYDEHEALMYQSMIPEEFPINDIFFKSIINNGNNVLAIEVHNISAASSDLTLLPFLSLGINNASIIYGTVPFWFNKGISLLHTNFKISNNGETIALSDPANTIQDKYTTSFIQIDNSIGRQPDGTSTWKFFGTPTPNSTNNGSVAYKGYVNDVFFSLPAGFYQLPQSLMLANSQSSTIIRYTTNSSLPTTVSTVYSTPIEIDSTKVIRVQCFNASGEYLPSRVSTNTYFINENISLPVVSVSTDSANLWDFNTGIYELGPNAEVDVPYFGANFWQNWEKPAHIEYFDKQDVQGFELDAGIRINGGWSRSAPQKSLRITAKSKYGYSDIKYKVFEEKNISSFKQLLLRNSGNDWNVTQFRDGLMHMNVLKSTFNDIQAFKASIVFLNGKYWGVHNIREKISKYYLYDNHGVNPDSVDLLNFDGVVIEGDNENYIQFATFVLFNDMSDSIIYNEVKKMLDMDNFCDHFITQTYYTNWDWPQNNIKYWRAKKPDAKWRYILTDLDFGLGLGSSYTFNDLNRAITSTNNVHSMIFSRLLQNITFRNYFINRYADLINTIFLPDSLRTLAYQFKDSIKAEMPRHFDKWGNGDMESWEQWNINNVLINFIDNRPAFARNHIQEEFNLNKQVQITLKVYPENAGKINISTITPGKYPFAGVYYDGVPVKITAIPNPGYEFSFWQSFILKPNPDFNSSFTINIDTNDVFIAYFYGTPDTPKVVFSEINYLSDSLADAGDWVELHNYGTVKADLSNWTFKDSNNNNAYILPAGTILYPGNYLVIYNDAAKFNNRFSSISNAIGPFNFGLNTNGEWLRLYETNNLLHTSVSYQSTVPWPSEPKGKGKTLELLNYDGNLNDPLNWFAGCSGGSPGRKFVICDSLASIEKITAFDINDVKLYPNPFNEKTTIQIRLKQATDISIKIFDMPGKALLTVAQGYYDKGSYHFTVNAKDLQSGMYFCCLKTDKGSYCQKMMVVK